MRVGRRDEQAAEQADVLEEVDLLLGPDLRVVLLPEAVPGKRGGHERRRERGGGKAGELAERQHRPGDDLDTGIDLDQRLVVRTPVQRSDLRRLVHRGLDRLEHRLRDPRVGLGRAQCLDATGDEDGSEHGTGYAAQDHARTLPG